MKTTQLTHLEVENKKKTKEIVVVTEGIRTPENVGMIFRISEAFGVRKVYLVGQTPDLTNKKVQRTARSTEKEIEIQFLEEMPELIETLKKEKFKIIGLELTNTSKSIKKISIKKEKKIALIIGAERFGIEKETLAKIETTIHIDLYGKNSSINVVNALGICLYEITR